MEKLEGTALLTERIAIKDVIDSYARFADTRNAKAQMDLFAEDSLFKVYYDPKSPTPSQVVTGKKDLAPVFDQLNAYQATMHFNGQTTITALDESSAAAITYCMAHHLTVADGVQKFMVAAIRYDDIFAKRNGKWLFVERNLFVDWIENR